PAVAQRRRQVEQPAVEVERLLGGQEAVQVRLLGQVTDALVLADVGGRLAEDVGLAVGREEQAEQQLDRRRLAGAVWTEQAEDIATVDLEVEGPQGGFLLPAPEVAVDLGELPRLDDDFTAHAAASTSVGSEQWAVGREEKSRSSLPTAHCSLPTVD